MRQQRRARKPIRFAAAGVAAIAWIAIFAAGCDSRINVRGLNLPTVPVPPPTPAGAMASETRPIAGVDAVALKAVGMVEIAIGAVESLTITAPESVMPLLTSDVSGGRLDLDRDSPSYQGQVSDIHYEIVLRRLDELMLEGVGQIDVTGIDNGRFSARLGGVGEVLATGRTDRQVVRVAGLGEYMAPALDSRVAEVHLASGKAVIRASERIEGWVGFGATLEYWGNPEVAVEGGGTVTRLGLKP